MLGCGLHGCSHVLCDYYACAVHVCVCGMVSVVLAASLYFVISLKGKCPAECSTQCTKGCSLITLTQEMLEASMILSVT